MSGDFGQGRTLESLDAAVSRQNCKLCLVVLKVCVCPRSGNSVTSTVGAVWTLVLPAWCSTIHLDVDERGDGPWIRIIRAVLDSPCLKFYVGIVHPAAKIIE